jgi:hypothetical protein
LRKQDIKSIFTGVPEIGVSRGADTAVWGAPALHPSFEDVVPTLAPPYGGPKNFSFLFTIF